MAYFPNSRPAIGGYLSITALVITTDNDWLTSAEMLRVARFIASVLRARTVGPACSSEAEVATWHMCWDRSSYMLLAREGTSLWENVVIREKFMAMADFSKLLVIFKRGRLKQAVEQAYERFLELPVPLVLAVLWFAGLTILGFIGLALYLYGMSLVRVLVGG